MTAKKAVAAPAAAPAATTNGDESAPAANAELALTDEQAADEAWPHETIEFMGDTLGVRKPTQQALSAFSLASSKFVSMETRNDITGLFIARHLSPASYDRVFSRLMDPDDDGYTVETIGELMRVVVELTVGPTAPADKPG